jgi:hypothetical protein
LEKYDLIEEKIVKCLFTKKYDSPKADIDSKWLRSVLGFHQYLANSARPALAYIVNYLISFQEKPTEVILGMATRLLCYVNGTQNYRPIYNMSEKFCNKYSVDLYADADFA